MQIGKVLFVIHSPSPFVWLDWREAAEIYVDVVNCRNNSEVKCSCMAIYSHQRSHKPPLRWPKMICELCFTWRIDNLGKHESTVVCLKCKQRSWWNNKTNDTQCLRSTRPISLARRARNKARILANNVWRRSFFMSSFMIYVGDVIFR